MDSLSHSHAHHLRLNHQLTGRREFLQNESMTQCKQQCEGNWRCQSFLSGELDVSGQDKRTCQSPSAEMGSDTSISAELALRFLAKKLESLEEANWLEEGV
jgi:hypothetical protein